MYISEILVITLLTLLWPQLLQRHLQEVMCNPMPYRSFEHKKLCLPCCFYTEIDSPTSCTELLCIKLTCSVINVIDAPTLHYKASSSYNVTIKSGGRDFQQGTFLFQWRVTTLRLQNFQIMSQNFTSTLHELNFILTHIHKLHFIYKSGSLYQNSSKLSISWDIMPCSLLKINISKEHITSSSKMFCLSPAFTLVSCLAYSLTLIMVVIRSFKTSDFRLTTSIVTITVRTSNPTEFCMPNNFSLFHLCHMC
jgi:hypothetical protein